MRKLVFTLLCGFFFAGISTAAPLVIPKYKLETSRRVFEQLILARGDFGLPKPQLELLSNPGELARFSGQTIFLGEKAYDICASFGADSLNALAALLSHELIHYYAGHTWEEEFSREFASAQLNQEVKDSWLKDEVQADLWGGLLAFSAGYYVQGVLPEFLPRLYQSYDLGEEIAGYPHLSERIALAKKSAEKLDILLRYFETANYLVAIGMYEDAFGYYQAILNEGYRGREIYNNIGVYHVMAALQLFRRSEMPYRLPLELDVTSRTKREASDTKSLEFDDEREHLLREGLRYFETARDMDPAYTTALVNMGCVYAMLGAMAWSPDDADMHFSQAQLYAKKAEREAADRPKQLADARVLHGLLAALQKDTLEARRFWETAATPLASANLQVLEKGVFGVAAERLPKASEREMIEEFSLDLFLRKPQCDTLTGLDSAIGKIQWGKGRNKINLLHSRIYLHLVNPARYAVAHITDPDYQGQTLLGIRIGDEREKVLSAYKSPDGVVQIDSGEFLCYPAREIVFRLDAEQCVSGWCVFRAAKP